MEFLFLQAVKTGSQLNSCTQLNLEHLSKDVPHLILSCWSLWISADFVDVPYQQYFGVELSLTPLPL